MKRITERWHTDSAGRKGDEVTEGTTYFHPVSQHLYYIEGVYLDTERGLWMVHYRRSNDKEQQVNDFVHAIEDFLRPGRFIEVLS